MRPAPRFLLRAWVVLWAAVAWTAAGCGGPEFPKTYPLSGTVLLPDGKPLQSGMIEFESVSDPNLRAIGEIEKDGTFARVHTYKSNGREVEGLVEGEHRVRIEVPAPDEDEGGGRDAGEDEGPAARRRKPPLVDPRYRAFDTSGLKITVPAPGNRATIQLEKSKR